MIPAPAIDAIDPMTARDWPSVSAIYREGISTGNATFASEPPATWDSWVAAHLDCGSLVARSAGTVVGWTALSRVSSRCVYSGVAELSIYVAAAARGNGVGGRLLRALIEASEADGLWTLQAGIFPENTASLALHRRFGFRDLGIRERVGKMTHGPWAGRWRDVLLLERRSTRVGID